MNTLLVYEQVPDLTDFYLVPNDFIQEKGWLPLLEEAHTKFVNVDEYNAGLAFIVAATTDAKHVDDDSYFANDDFMKKEWRCVFHRYKVLDKKRLDCVHITRVISCGFIL